MFNVYIKSNKRIYTDFKMYFKNPRKSMINLRQKYHRRNVANLYLSIPLSSSSRNTKEQRRTELSRSSRNDKLTTSVRTSEGHDGKRFHAIGHLWLSLHRRHYRRQSIYRPATINGPCVHRLTSTIVEHTHHHGIAEFLAVAT